MGSPSKPQLRKNPSQNRSGNNQNQTSPLESPRKPQFRRNPSNTRSGNNQNQTSPRAQIKKQPQQPTNRPQQVNKQQQMNNKQQQQPNKQQTNKQQEKKTEQHTKVESKEESKILEGSGGSETKSQSLLDFMKNSASGKLNWYEDDDQLASDQVMSTLMSHYSPPIDYTAVIENPSMLSAITGDINDTPSNQSDQSSQKSPKKRKQRKKGGS
jgi:hypothetical protein